MYRWIDQVDYKRKKKGKSIEWLCEGACSTNTYTAYMRGESSPTEEVIMKFCSKLGIHIFLQDSSITLTLKPVDWALVSLYYDSHHMDAYAAYSKVFGQNFRPDNVFYMACKMAAFMAFFFRSTNNNPPYDVLEAQFVCEYEISYLKTVAQDYGMLGPTGEPSQEMHRYYVKLTDLVDDFLTNAGLRYQINEDIDGD